MPKLRTRKRHDRQAAGPVRPLRKIGKWAAVIPLLALLIATAIGFFGSSLISGQATGGATQNYSQVGASGANP